MGLVTETSDLSVEHGEKLPRSKSLCLTLTCVAAWFLYLGEK